MNKSFEKFYRHFERPPFAPTYYPTEEEFADPITYIAKIKPEAERYGVVKIKPPPSFHPPFAIDSEHFEFTPRVQKLNQIEALVRAKLIFDTEIANFWHLKGQPLHVPSIDNKYVDLFRLSTAVAQAGGAITVCNHKKWPQIAKQLGFKNHPGTRIRDIYTKWVAPFEDALLEVYKIDEENESRAEECVKSMQGRRRVPEPRTKSMAGLRHTVKEKKVKSIDPMDEVMCKKCGRGDDENCLLLCDDCDYALHTYCCEPPLNAVPKGEWRCQKCVIAAIKEIADSFGFHDSQVKYNLLTFAEYANEWKRNYFHQNPMDVPCEVVENEFWKKVIDLENTVAVKYGADLLATKVGSGFPMPGKDFSGCSDAKEREYYAKHPWNLNNMPILKESVLSHIESGISGMMVPWVYIGMCFSAFCWHTEDHWTYSVNYMHWGERKIWYGVSGLDGAHFDDVVKGLVPDLFEKQPDLLHHMTTTVNPAVLLHKGVNVYTVHQEPGEFVITFPRSYHAGYNEGLNCAEAVNFAPADWLRKGWLCTFDYARVRRNCVFSYEELIVRMAKNADQLSIGMCVAAYEQMHEICGREARLRQSVADMGVVKTAQEEYELIADDLRSCAVCKTTLFMSGLQCKHGRLVCLEHADGLCSKCAPSDLTLKYRYTLDELAPLLKSLEGNTNAFADWRNKLGDLLEARNDHKPTVEDIKSMIEIARSQRFPQCDVLERALSTVKHCEQVAHAATVMLNRKIRTRSKGRFSSGERAEMADIENMRASVQTLPCLMPELEANIKEYMERVEKWRSEAANLLSGASTESGIALIDSLQRILDEADDFNINLPELTPLEQMLSRNQWLLCAEKLLNWDHDTKKSQRESNDESDDDEYCSRGRWRLQKLMSIVNEGSRIMEGDANIQKTVNAIHSMMKQGYQHEHLAETVLSERCNEGIGLEEVERIWAPLQKSDWMSETNIDHLRSEVVKARRLNRFFQKAKEGECTLKELEDMQVECANSLFMRGSPLHTELSDMQTHLEMFCERVRQMFARSPSYYSLVEVLAGRDDLAVLIEGSPSPLIRFSARTLHDDWSAINQFESTEQLREHLSRVHEQERRLMTVLRRANDLRSLKETCSCSSEKDDRDGSIACLLCHSKFHASCAQWDAYLSRLPVGYYLCVRCVRGRRPLFEDARCATVNAPPSLEKTLVMHLLERSSKDYEEALETATKVSQSMSSPDEQLIQKLDGCIISVLCAEVMDMDSWSRIAQALPAVRAVCDGERAIYEQIRARPVTAESPFVLFAGGMSLKKTKRPSSSSLTSQKHRKRIRNVYHNDKEQCSAENCLKPYSEHVRWIQCEAGCSRWYHYVCVGQSVGQAEHITSYCCYKCSAKARSQPSTST
uniref:[histone H3]-trimethyl-L-lysine(4) demethylase n=1 Tax=Ascaris suum TaxID=6253 RepID=F1KQT2_ASCSU